MEFLWRFKPNASGAVLLLDRLVRESTLHVYPKDFATGASVLELIIASIVRLSPALIRQHKGPEDAKTPPRIGKKFTYQNWVVGRLTWDPFHFMHTHLWYNFGCQHCREHSTCGPLHQRHATGTYDFQCFCSDFFFLNFFPIVR